MYFLFGSMASLRILDSADMSAQVVDDVGESGSVGHVEMARALKLDPVKAHDSARPLAHDVYSIRKKDRFPQIVRDQNDREILCTPKVAQYTP